MFVSPSREWENPQNSTLCDHLKFTILILQPMTENSRKCPKLFTHKGIKEPQIWLGAERCLYYGPPLRRKAWCSRYQEQQWEVTSPPSYLLWETSALDFNVTNQYDPIYQVHFTEAMCKLLKYRLFSSYKYVPVVKRENWPQPFLNNVNIYWTILEEENWDLIFVHSILPSHPWNWDKWTKMSYDLTLHLEILYWTLLIFITWIPFRKDVWW